jgi:predicted transcriptional regulator
MRQLLLIVLAVMLPVIAPASEERSALTNTKATEFTLQDQYEKTISLKQLEGRIVVLIASDKEGKEQNAAWTRAIRDKYADRILVQGIANVSSVPFFLKGKIRNDFRKEGDSILLDWKGEVFEAYNLTKGVSNVILIDTRGMIHYRSSGPASPEAVRELFRKIEASNY